LLCAFPLCGSATYLHVVSQKSSVWI